jgi:uncharacterized membrane protein YphA (DoxX/SURF4 family)
MPRLDRATLWEYLGHPDDEPPERRRILYAIVILRLGLGLLFLTRGWGAIVAPAPDAVAARLGDPARWGLGGEPLRDQALFLLGCTELGVGALLLAGAFTRVSAVTGSVLLLLLLLFGARDAGAAGAALAALGGLLLVVLCGSPFLSADRFLDKVEEEERDRAPVTLPRPATATPLLPRLGVAGGLLWLAVRDAPALPLPSLMAPALAILAATVAAGLATRLVGPLGGGLLALLAGGDSAWWPLGPLAVAGALALTGGGRLSLDRLWDRRVAPDSAPSPRGRGPMP